MGVLRAAIGVTGWTALGSAVAFTVWTRKCTIQTIPANDYLLSNTYLTRWNPNDTPIFQDACIRRVPIDKIDPELLGKENEGRLVERFCAGVWSGRAYSIQRRILELTNRGPDTEHQLWAHRDLASSAYNVGAEVTDHFEVLAKTQDSIIVRAGDSPLRQEIRASDGIGELVADVKKEDGEVEFSFKVVFFNGLAGPEVKRPPLSGILVLLHQLYAKALVENGVKNCMIA